MLRMQSYDVGDLEEYGTEVVVLSEHGAHPNIVAFYGAFYHEDTLWVMLELCTGGSVDCAALTAKHSHWQHCQHF